LIAINLVSQRRELYHGLKEIRKFILPAVLMYVSEILCIAGVYMLTPTVAVLLFKSSTLFVMLLSFVFFADERRIMRSKSFIFGSLFVAVGVCGVIVGKGSLHLNGFNLGVVLILMGCVCMGLYYVLIKITVRKIGAFVSAGVVFTL
jgi:drug/metabolite transporter (DMT)-like permease